MNLHAALAQFDPELPIAEARTPPASWYTAPPFHENEKAKVFRTNWQFVGHRAQLQQPGDYLTGIMLGWPYVVVLDESDTLRAFYNVCSHHGTCVAKGAGTLRQFVCPYHGWTYGLQGALLKAPRAGALQSLQSRNLDLKPLHVETWGPFVALHFGQPSSSLAAALQGLSEQFHRDAFANLRFVQRRSYEIDCNWKVYVDNYLDGGYHVPHMHPNLSAQLDIASYQTTLGDRWSMQACEAKTEAPSAPSGDFSGRLGEQAQYAWIHPNFMINRYGPWMDCNTVIPLSENRCKTVFDYYYEGQPQPELLERALAASDKVQQEDIEICHMVQTGLGSGAYEQGIYSPRFESPMLHFHRLLARELSADMPT